MTGLLVDKVVCIYHTMNFCKTDDIKRISGMENKSRGNFSNKHRELYGQFKIK